MATFRKRSDAWQVRIQRSGYPEQSKTFKAHSEAVAWARKIESEYDAGINLLQVPTVVILKDLLSRYLKEVTSTKKHPDVETYRINAWLRHPLATRNAGSLRTADFAKWRDERIEAGRSANTIRLELAIISNLYTVASSEWGYESLINPTTKIKLPRLPSGRSRRIKGDELELLVNSSESKILKSIVPLAVETAMRRSELVAMQWQHLDLGKRKVFIPLTKNGEAREVPLSPKAIEILSALPSSSEGAIFNLTAHAVSVAFVRACKRSSIQGLHFHDLRHEAISRLFERGLSIAEVGSISGHKTWTMLRRYTHLSAERLAMKLV